MKAEHIKRFMWQAIHEGRKAIGHCAPNPPVGCVIVENSSIIAMGHTGAPGLPHAEAMALGALQGTPNNISVFVTLEPCSYHGRTPSCAEALAKRSVKNVYVGIIDPHPKNRGAGIKILENAGIQVITGVLKREIYCDLSAHLYRGG